MIESVFAVSLTSRALAIGIAVVLDAIVGDPQVSWHPVRLMGNLCSSAEKWTRTKVRPWSAGLLTWVFVLTVVVVFGIAILVAARLGGEIVSVIAGAIMIYVTISARDLAKHAWRVRTAVDEGNLQEARGRLSFMVSRDTGAMSFSDVVRGTVESVSENLGDGVIAPLFYAALFGPVGALAYRAINTMDAMFGYRNERYVEFGRWSARADDVANLIPSRIAGALVCFAGIRHLDPFTALRQVARYAPQHESPNAGYPEAAAAAVLGVQLGGPGVYHGVIKEKPVLGDKLREIEPADINRCVNLMWGATAEMVAGIVAILLIL